jgi:hypothetical protein
MQLVCQQADQSFIQVFYSHSDLVSHFSTLSMLFAK